MAGSLPKALQRIGLDVRVITPAWPGVMKKVEEAGHKTVELPQRVRVSYAWSVREAAVIHTDVDGVPVYFLRSEDYGGDMYPPVLNFQSVRPFAIFSLQALELHTTSGWEPDIYHCHDWTSAFLPCALAWHRHYRHKNAKCIITLHNVAHQGVFPPDSFLDESGLEPWAFDMERLEFHGQINLLKGAIVAADAVTTVSPRYAQEIQTYESTQELSGIIFRQRHKLHGILNGIDTDFWNPETDPLLPANYSIQKPDGKVECRNALLKEAELPASSPGPVVVCVSRLVEQKGFSLILPALQHFPSLGARFIFLGSGHAWIENALQHASDQNPAVLRFFRGYNEPLSHLLYAGGDIFLMPSVFEPCGLSQMIAMRYGTVPVVREVGGLRDTVFDVDNPEGGNGFTFLTCDTSGMMWALRRAVTRFSKTALWKKIVKRDMQENFTWDKSALLYEKLYREMASVPNK